MTIDLNNQLEQIVYQYAESFKAKEFSEENNDHDVIMDLFDITPDVKRTNRQYWGRELGMCWQRLVSTSLRVHHLTYADPIKYGKDEPYDCRVSNLAIDTKYRIGSGDAGTLKKFKLYSEMLRNDGLIPTLLIVRDDNLPAAITACKTAGWDTYIGKDTFDKLDDLMPQFSLIEWLRDKKGFFSIST